MTRQAYGTNIQLFLVAILGVYQVYSQSDVSANSSANTFNATLACTIVQNGTFLKDPRSCSKWIQCADKEPISGSCPKGLFYNRNTNECVDPDSIKCYSSEPCADVTTDGSFVPDLYSCSSYYYCSEGKATLGLCSSGLNYNPEKQVCIQNFTCPADNVNPDSWCNIIPDGQFFADLQRCQGYNFCKNGSLENGTCPNGYYFNSFKSICDYKDNVECLHYVKHEMIKSGEGLYQTEGQFLSDNKTCTGYFYCQQEISKEFQLVWRNCSNGRFFDSTNGGKCGYRRDVQCKFDRCEGMGLKSIELINAQVDSCKGYLICQDGKQIGSGVCPDEEQYFDEDLQRCTGSVVEYPACSLGSDGK